jgi:VCBS repeat-containing protein
MYTVGRHYLAGEGVEYQPDDAYFMLGLGLRFNGGPAIGPFKDMLQYNMNLAAVDLTPARIAELNDAISSWSVGDPTPVNDSPVGSLIPETNSIYINQVAAGTLLAGTDRDGNRLNFQLVEGSVVNGTVVIDAANAQYIFTPAADFLGEASFQYVLSDGHATSEPKLVTIIVNNITSAVADMGSVGETDTLSVGAASGLLSNDTLASGATTVSVVAVNGANADVGRQLDTPYGKLTINADGSYTFIADVVALIEGEEVTVTTTYVIADDLGNLSASELLITVLGRDGTAIVGSGTLSGTPFADSITGLAGNDLLRGFGGANILDGGAGLDYAVYDAAPSVIFVNLATGIAQQNGYDSIDILLNVENVTGSAFNDVVIGDDNDNVLSGGGGNDVLAGGSGNDILVGGDGASNELIGGTGNDTYIVTASGDTIVELAGGGIDTVRTNLDSHVLKDHVENLVYTGSGNFIGSGNDLDNLIVSGPGDDILNGKDGADVLVGGAGNDILIGGDGLPNQLIGGTGNDTYIITTAGDSIVELVGEGIDTVRTNLDSYVLKDHVENLVYTGNGDFTGIGNSANNVLIGGAGNDFLSGMAGNDILDGGAGANTLLGGQGFDQFRISSIDGGIDRIHDFLSGEDKLLLSEELFGASANFDFSVGTDAAGVGPTFLYDPLSGLVRYDADGTGGTVPVVIARLNPGLTLVADDFGFF